MTLFERLQWSTEDMTKCGHLSIWAYLITNTNGLKSYTWCKGLKKGLEQIGSHMIKVGAELAEIPIDFMTNKNKLNFIIPLKSTMLMSSKGKPGLSWPVVKSGHEVVKFC